MQCPFATWRPISANTGPAQPAPIGLVVHVQQGTGSLYDFFNSPNAQVSAHFWCAQDGTLEQYVDTDNAAWAEAAGNYAPPDGNGPYLSVETEGTEDTPLTSAQIETLARLAAWCHNAFSIPLVHVDHGQPGVTQHCFSDGSPDPNWGDHPCPGTIRLGQVPTVVSIATILATTENLMSLTSCYNQSTNTVHVFGVGKAGTGWDGHLVELTNDGKNANGGAGGWSFYDHSSGGGAPVFDG